MEITLDVQARTETGKGPAKRARAAGKVPAVFYGSHDDPQPVYVDARQMSHALHTEAGANVLINLNINGTTHLAVPREIQRHPIRGTLIHIDFIHVARDVKIHAEVPVHAIGEAHGVKEGGQLDVYIHTLQVEALPSDVPSVIEIDVSPLGIGQQVTVGGIKPYKGVTILNDPDDIVLAVHSETLLEVEAEEEEAEAPEAAAGEGEAEAPAAQEPSEG